MEQMKKLPDAEFDIMKVVWANEPPITTNMIMARLGTERGWQAQTVSSLMLRLVERGFLSTDKRGKERIYFPLVGRDDYLRFETSSFMRQYHDNSLLDLVSTLYDDKALTDDDIDDLLRWAKQRRE